MLPSSRQSTFSYWWTYLIPDIYIFLKISRLSLTILTGMLESSKALEIQILDLFFNIWFINIVKTKGIKPFKGIFDEPCSRMIFIYYNFQQQITYVASINCGIFVLWNNHFFFFTIPEKNVFKVSEIFWLFDRVTPFSTRECVN